MCDITSMLDGAAAKTKWLACMISNRGAQLMELQSAVKTASNLQPVFNHGGALDTKI